MTENPTAIELQKYLGGVDYPASKDDLVRVARSNGAPDDVAGALEPFAGDTRIRFLKTDNGGLSVARNRAVAVARAPWVALLDGDDIYEPRYVETMLAEIARDPAVGSPTLVPLRGRVPR